MLAFLSVIGSTQTDNAQSIVSKREYHAKNSTVKRNEAHLADLAVIATRILSAHNLMPGDLARDTQ
jgi:hypothetical protein